MDDPYKMNGKVNKILEKIDSPPKKNNQIYNVFCGMCLETNERKKQSKDFHNILTKTNIETMFCQEILKV